MAAELAVGAGVEAARRTVAAPSVHLHGARGPGLMAVSGAHSLRRLCGFAEAAVGGAV
jgi:hypothetical protein